MILVNNQKIIDDKFAYDNCHKIYIIEDEEDLQKATDLGYNIYNIDELEQKYRNSCDYRFIDNWKLTKSYVKQGEMATFQEIEKEM